MPESIEDFVKMLGTDEGQFKGVNELPAIERTLIKAAALFIDEVKNNLIDQNKIYKGGLSSGIAQGGLIKKTDGYSIVVGYERGSSESKYYDFVNKGVQGVKVNRAAKSPYKFRKLTAGGKMVENIEEWYKKQGKTFSLKYSPVSKRERKAKKLGEILSGSKKNKSLAYATAISIKRRGFKPTHFFDNAVKNVLGKNFSKAIAMAGGKDVTIILKKAFKNGNNNS